MCMHANMNVNVDVDAKTEVHANMIRITTKGVDVEMSAKSTSRDFTVIPTTYA